MSITVLLRVELLRWHSGLRDTTSSPDPTLAADSAETWD